MSPPCQGAAGSSGPHGRFPCPGGVRTSPRHWDESATTLFHGRSKAASGPITVSVRFARSASATNPSRSTSSSKCACARNTTSAAFEPFRVFRSNPNVSRAASGFPARTSASGASSSAGSATTADGFPPSAATCHAVGRFGVAETDARARAISACAAFVSAVTSTTTRTPDDGASARTRPMQRANALASVLDPRTTTSRATGAGAAGFPRGPTLSLA